jgi:hypothetical protein
MFYCPKCSNLYDISDNFNKKKSGSITTSKEVITNILDDTEDIPYVSTQKIIKSREFRKLMDDDKKKVKDFLKTMEKTNKESEEKKIGGDKKINKIYFVCNNCGNYEEIHDETLIAGKYFGTYAINVSYNYSDYANDSTLPITRNYICHNKECESHKDPKKKQAVFFREINTYNVRYICKTCGTSWN